MDDGFLLCVRLGPVLFFLVTITITVTFSLKTYEQTLPLRCSKGQERGSTDDVYPTYLLLYIVCFIPFPPLLFYESTMINSLDYKRPVSRKSLPLTYTHLQAGRSRRTRSLCSLHPYIPLNHSGNFGDLNNDKRGFLF